MRTTNNMLINNMMFYMNNNLNRMSKLQTQLATGKKIDVPSDDPIVAARALKFRTDVSEVEQFQSNAKDAYSWMDMTESALGKVGDILQDAYEKAVDASNGSKTPEDRRKIRDVILQHKEQLIHVANSSYAGRYIFSGFATDSKLMNTDGTYNVSVSSKDTAVIKSGLVELKPAESINTATNNTFEISLDGTNYYTVKLTSGKNYDGTVAGGRTLADLTREIQNSLQTAVPIAPAPPLPDQLKEIKVTENSGRVEFSLNNVTDKNGNKVSVFLREPAANGILDKMNISLKGIPGISVSKPEDVKYQVGIGDLLNVNVPGSELFGSGVKGEAGELISKLDKYIDALDYDNNKSYLSSRVIAAGASNPIDFSAGGYSFNISVNGAASTTINIPATKYDGTPGKGMSDLLNSVQTAIDLDPALKAANVKVAYEKNKIVFSADAGNKITLAEGPAGKNALSLMNISTETNKTVTSVTAQEGITNAIADMKALMNKVLSVRSDVGARMNRSELTLNRLSSDEINFTKLMSENEDVDQAEVIMKLTSEENVYKASLAGGARIIMPTLIDFLR